MTKAEKRVAIAKDAIQQLALGKYKSTPGTYVSATVTPKVTDCVGANLLDKAKTCEVCAMGALLLSEMRTTGCNVGGEDGSYQWYESQKASINVSFGNGLIRSVFSECMLRDMENSFEQTDENRISEIQNASERLFAILENVVRNGGTFVRPKDLWEERKGDADRYAAGVKRRFAKVVAKYRPKRATARSIAVLPNAQQIFCNA